MNDGQEEIILPKTLTPRERLGGGFVVLGRSIDEYYSDLSGGQRFIPLLMRMMNCCLSSYSTFTSYKFSGSVPIIPSLTSPRIVPDTIYSRLRI